MDRFQAMSVFVRVVDAGSFSAAARLVGMGQPAVSKIVAQLEAEIGVRLLMRTTQRVISTEAGQRFYERATLALQEAAEAELAARGSGMGLTGRLRVSAATTFARLHVIPKLDGFLDQHPELSVDVVLDDRPIDLVAEGIDLSLRMGDLPESGLVARRLGTSPRSVFASQLYLQRHGVPATPADLAKHQVLLFSQSTQSWPFRRNGTEASVVVGGRIRLSAAEGVRAAVLAGLGVAITSDWMFSPEISSGQVTRLLEDWTLPHVDLWAVFPTGRLASTKARAFADFVDTELRKSSMLISEPAEALAPAGLANPKRRSSRS